MLYNSIRYKAVESTKKGAKVITFKVLELEFRWTDADLLAVYSLR